MSVSSGVAITFGAKHAMLGLLLTTLPVIVNAQAADTVSAPSFSAARLTSPPAENSTALAANLDNGSTIYDSACNACHGESGEGGHDGGPDLRNTALSSSQIMLVVNAGRNAMPAFAGFTAQELLDISTFVKEALY